MTERELRLRQRIDDLLDQRAEDAVTIQGLREKIERFRGPPGHCHWCGRRTRGRYCSLHQDVERTVREMYG